MAAAISLAQDSLSRQKASAQRVQATAERQRASASRQMLAASREPADSWWTAAASSGARWDCDPVSEDRLRSIIMTAAEREGVNPLLIQAVIRRESGARPCAVSEKGAQGLMQLMPATQDHLGVADPFDPAENVSGGTRYLREMLRRYKGDIPLALAAYNAGPQRVESELPDIAETRSYVKAIMADLSRANEREP